MRNITLILSFLICLSVGAQIQNFNLPVKFNSVTEVDSVNYVYGEGDSGIMVKLEMTDVGEKNHNALDSLQGGQSSEYYHLSESQHERVLDLIYINGTSTFSVSPSSGERGVSTSLTVNYNIVSNDDIFGTASINQGIGDVSADIDEGASTASGGSSVVNKSFTLTLNYTRQGVAEEETKSATYTAHIPQWRGVSAETDFTTYAGLNGELTKFVQSSAATSMTISPSDDYIWFVSNKSNAVIKDGNGFTQTIGTWGDGVSEFYTKSLSLTLADGSTVETVYLYRTRLTKSFTNLTYTIQ